MVSFRIQTKFDEAFHRAKSIIVMLKVIESLGHHLLGFRYGILVGLYGLGIATPLGIVESP